MPGSPRAAALPPAVGRRRKVKTPKGGFRDVRTYPHYGSISARPYGLGRVPRGRIGILGRQGRSCHELTVTSSLVMVEYRNDRQRVWGGLVEHRLRRMDGDLRIAAKRVDLINSESELDGIACLF